MSGVASAAAGQEIFVEGQRSRRHARPEQYLLQDRYNYMKAGKQLVKEAPVLGLTADAVSVGSDHILNVFLWEPSKEQAYLCPPQATGPLPVFRPRGPQNLPTYSGTAPPFPEFLGPRGPQKPADILWDRASVLEICWVFFLRKPSSLDPDRHTLGPRLGPGPDPPEDYSRRDLLWDRASVFGNFHVENFPFFGAFSRVFLRF